MYLNDVALTLPAYTQTTKKLHRYVLWVYGAKSFLFTRIPAPT